MGLKVGPVLLPVLLTAHVKKIHIYLHMYSIYSFLNKLVLLTKLPQKEGQQGPKANLKPPGPHCRVNLAMVNTCQLMQLITLCFNGDPLMFRHLEHLTVLKPTNIQGFSLRVEALSNIYFAQLSCQKL